MAKGILTTRVYPDYQHFKQSTQNKYHAHKSFGFRNCIQNKGVIFFNREQILILSFKNYFSPHKTQTLWTVNSGGIVE